METKNLAEMVREIDPELRFERAFGAGGGYGLVVKVTKGEKPFRLKINRTSDLPGREDTLEDEYRILKDLSKTGASPKAIKLYDNAPSMMNEAKGKNAYLTGFISGNVLSKTEGHSELSLESKLVDLVRRIHGAGYKIGKNTDFNGDNILYGEDGRLYCIDPMMLEAATGKEASSISLEESRRIHEIARRYSGR